MHRDGPWGCALSGTCYHALMHTQTRACVHTHTHMPSGAQAPPGCPHTYTDTLICAHLHSCTHANARHVSETAVGATVTVFLWQISRPQSAMRGGREETARSVAMGLPPFFRSPVSSLRSYEARPSPGYTSPDSNRGSDLDKQVTWF